MQAGSSLRSSHNLIAFISNIDFLISEGSLFNSKSRAIYRAPKCIFWKKIITWIANPSKWIYNIPHKYNLYDT